MRVCVCVWVSLANSTSSHSSMSKSAKSAAYSSWKRSETPVMYIVGFYCCFYVIDTTFVALRYCYVSALIIHFC